MHLPRGRVPHTWDAYFTELCNDHIWRKSLRHWGDQGLLLMASPSSSYSQQGIHSFLGSGINLASGRKSQGRFVLMIILFPLTWYISFLLYSFQSVGFERVIHLQTEYKYLLNVYSRFGFWIMEVTSVISQRQRWLTQKKSLINFPSRMPVETAVVSVRVFVCQHRNILPNHIPSEGLNPVRTLNSYREPVSYSCASILCGH